MWLVLGLLACSRAVSVPPVAAAAAAAETPEEGWYNSACYRALDGELDLALAHLERSIRRGEAPLDWMGRDPDLVSVRADPRYVAMRDGAIDAWIAAAPPETAEQWLAVAEARRVQGRDPAPAIEQAEAQGHVHAVFGPALPPITDGLRDRDARRAAFVEARRGRIVVEDPPAFELANIILSQTAYGQTPNATERDSAYAAAVDAWFSPHREHPLIEALDARPVDIWVYYAFRNQAAAWELTPDGALRPSPVYAVGGFWGYDPFAEHRALIEDFVRDTDALAFLEQHRGAIDARIAEYEAKVPIRAMWDWLEARFPGEDDGRDALVVRSSLLIGGSHNASTLELEGFTEGTMVVPIMLRAASIAPDDVGPLGRMVFTEIDHHYVTPISVQRAEEIDAALGDYRRFNAQPEGGGYESGQRTFDEYVTWVLFDVWWAEYCDTHGCTASQRAAGARDTERVMEQRGFTEYVAFRDAMVPALRDQKDLEAAFPRMLDWFRDFEPQ